MNYSKLCKLFLVLMLLLFPMVALAQENIDPDNDDSQYAWGENVGWLNLEPDFDGGPGVEVGGAVLTGYIWGENIGWINLAPIDGGVVNDGDGNLSGFAWGENVGWINFNPTIGSDVYGVYIDACGDFNGTAWGENIGWINFRSDGDNPFYVRTSWKSPLDEVAPVTTSDIPFDDWYTDDVFINLITSDCGYGATEVHYEIDGGGEVTVSGDSATVSITSTNCTTHTLSFWSVDQDVNIESANEVTIQIDKNPPTVAITRPGDGATYQINQIVTVDYSVTDSCSGVDEITATLPQDDTIVTTTPGSYTFTVSASDLAGNNNSITNSYSIATDNAPPIITITTPVDEAIYQINQIVIADYSVTDAGSGVDDVTATVPNGDPIDTSTAGQHTFVVSATDYVGNADSVTHTYTVGYPGNIDPDGNGSQYAYGENIGWINFKPSFGPGVTVTDTEVTGYAWGENIGWINLNPSQGGVIKNNGILSGYAWGENIGWINFAPTGAGVTINPDTGEFSGQAWAENVGWITFSSTGPVAYEMSTSWRGISDADGDGFNSDEDCNDNDPNIYPGATEVCNGLDNNCDGTVDDGIASVPTSCGVGECANTGTETCVNGQMVDNCVPGTPSEEVCDGLDNNCDGEADDNIAIEPTSCGVGECAATGVLACMDDQMVDNCAPGTPSEEVCDGLDNNCDGTVDDGIAPVQTTCGLGECSALGEITCVDGQLFDSCVSGDPSAEVCDGLDNDCNDLVDDDIAAIPTTCGVGTCASAGEITCVNGIEVDSCAPGVSGDEVCDGLDNDCDGETDEGVKPTFYLDSDGDGYGDLSSTTEACSAPDGYVADSTDCDDSNLNINPGMQELNFNDIDDDCNPETSDDNLAPVVYSVATVPVPMGSELCPVSATVDDTQDPGDSIISSAECKIDQGDWITMSAILDPFDNPIEDVTVTSTAPDAVGVYDVCVHGTDEDGNTSTDECTLLAVYDPSAGFVTGGGWIDSPAGAYKPDLLLTGKANFGFVAKYSKKTKMPEGNSEFVFKAADFNFHSSNYEWLVVNQDGTNAQFKGTGTINGEGNYRFMLWATDGDGYDPPIEDTFRIRIWEEDEFGNETVIYDNGFNQPIEGGSIVVHTSKDKKK